MKTSDAITIGGNVFTYVLSAVQTNEILQIISFILSALTSAALLAFRLWAWWKAAKKDGEITQKEIDEAINIIENNKGDNTEK